MTKHPEIPPWVDFLIRMKIEKEEVVAIHVRENHLSKIHEIMEFLKQSFGASRIILLNEVTSPSLRYKLLKEGKFLIVNNPKRLSNYIKETYLVLRRIANN
ncbi:MAG: hypothetical protein ACTSX9_00060 [Candidatus Njordarchaeales archaeon]